MNHQVLCLPVHHLKKNWSNQTIYFTLLKALFINAEKKRALPPVIGGGLFCKTTFVKKDPHLAPLATFICPCRQGWWRQGGISPKYFKRDIFIKFLHF
jgi:hypothetical protein